MIPSLTQADIDPEIGGAGLSGWGQEGAKHGRDYYFISAADFIEGKA